MTFGTAFSFSLKPFLTNLTFYKTPLRNASYYSILGLKTNASATAVKEAYYKLSKMYHPDTNFGHDDATGKIQEINEAFEILGNAQKKQAYDALNLPNVKQQLKNWKESFIYDTEPKFYNYQYEQEKEPNFTIKMEQNNYEYITARNARHDKGVAKRKWRHFVQKYIFHRNLFNKSLAKNYSVNKI